MARLSDDRLITALGVIPYQLPLKQPWKTSRGLVDCRQGLLVQLQTADGLIGFGDCGPWEPAGTESQLDARARLEEAVEALPDVSLGELPGILSRWKDTPAARCAVETAALDVMSQAATVPLSVWLSQQATGSVRVNAAVGTLQGDFERRCREAVGRGYQVLKLKVAIDSPPKEINKLQDLFDHLPSNVRVRLDANGGWDMAQAKRVFAALRDSPIESFEEPLRDPNQTNLLHLQALVPWPVALDESLARWPRMELLRNPPVRRVVCKPTVLGGLMETLRFAQALEQVGVEVVITTTLESAAGTWACAHLAAALNNTLAHGLTTAEWFEDNTGQAPEIRGDRLILSTRPGLGFIPA